MNKINKIIKKLDLDYKELSFLLSLSKEETKDLKKWAEGSKEIPAYILKKIDRLPSKNPYKFDGKGSFKFIDLFAGIGGIRLGFQKEGGKCVFTSEWDSKSASTYKVNFGDKPAGDITKVDPKKIPDFDILLGGFPCQAFSNAGLKQGFNDTRGTLFFDVARIIEEKKQFLFY